MLERTGAETSGVLEPLRFVLVYSTAHCFSTVAMIARTPFSVTLYIACRILLLYNLYIIAWLVYAWNISNVTTELCDVAIFWNCCLTKCASHKICGYVFTKSPCRITRGQPQRSVSLPHSTRRRKMFSHRSHVVILMFWKNFLFLDGALPYIIALSARDAGCFWL